MKMKNRFKLPASIVQALSLDTYEKEGDYSVTELIGPPRIHQIIKRNYDDIEIEVSENLWKMLGSLVHDLIARMFIRVQTESLNY